MSRRRRHTAWILALGFAALSCGAEAASTAAAPKSTANQRVMIRLMITKSRVFCCQAGVPRRAKKIVNGSMPRSSGTTATSPSVLNRIATEYVAKRVRAKSDPPSTVTVPTANIDQRPMSKYLSRRTR